jgi:hypothetical protein
MTGVRGRKNIDGPGQCAYPARREEQGKFMPRGLLFIRAWGLLGLLLVLVGVPSRAQAAPPSYAEQLVARAQQLKLAEQRTWLRLGHYRKGLFGWESEVDGNTFFNAIDGKVDPRAELDATLRAFFVSQARDPLIQHPMCRFPARFMWLARELSIDLAQLPRVQCPRYLEFVTKLNPRSITLIFSSYYLNNPASAFGHTFLRVNKATRKEEGEGRELLDYGVDYAAVVDTQNGLLYAFKGLFGLFPGTFSKMPFYYKVREYNDFESRDLWEYELDLSPEQVQMLVAHLWELGGTFFRYFYLSENCSYHILGALEVVDPKLELTSRVGWPVIPADTLKALLRNRGLVKSLRYRPSNRTQFKLRVETLSSSELAAVNALFDDPETKLDPSFSQAQQVRVLDAAIDLVGVQFARDLAKKRGDMDPQGIELEQKLLERRASYDLDSEEQRFPPPPDQYPHGGHDSSRLGLGSGYERYGGWYHTLSYRLTLHDLVDPARGYPDGSEIEFMTGSLRYYVESPKVTFEDFSLIRVRSISPLTRFDHKWSWMLDTGAKRVEDTGCDGCVGAFGLFGAGFALEPFGRALTLFALAKVEVNAPIKSGFADIFRVGIGPYGGVRLHFSDDVRALFTGTWSYLPGQRPWHTFEARGAVRAQYTRDFALGIEGRVMDRAASAQLVSYLYF